MDSHLFESYRVDPPRMARWPIVVAVLLGALFAVWAVHTKDQVYFEVQTHHGVRVIDEAMTRSDVKTVLGGPIARDPTDGQDCLRYGHPHFKTPFTVYSVCYREGHVRKVSAKKYMAHKVEADGTIDTVPSAAPAPPTPSP